MKLYLPAIIIGLIGGILDKCTDLHKVWCFLIGVATFLVYLLIESVIKTTVIMRKTKGSKKIWLDQNNSIIGHE